MMHSGPAASALLDGLFGDVEVAAYLSAPAEIAAMIQVERALAEVTAGLGFIPAEAGPAIVSGLEGLTLDPAEFIGPTAGAGVPVPGLVARLRDVVGPEYGRYIHWGATSQDIVDTALVLRLRPCLAIMETRLGRIVEALGAAAERYAHLPMAGRTRSQIATPVSFGLRVVGWRAPLVRCLERLAELRPRLMQVQLGGASGALSVYGDRGIQVMEALATVLDLGAPAKPWHAERDNLVELANWLAMVAGLLGRIGGDLILSGRSEIAEVRAGKGGGSSTMPQKTNPVLPEALVTIARYVSGQAGVAQQALMHQEERDGTAWSLEWLALPSMLIVTAASLAHAIQLAESLDPQQERMTAIMETGGGAIHAEALAFALARSMPLGEAQAIVKAASAEIARSGGSLIDAVAEECGKRGIPPPDPPTELPEVIGHLITRALSAGPSRR